VEPRDVEAPTARCPRCGAPHDPYQEYCLECGYRLPSRYYSVRRREVWSAESPLGLVAALIALLLVALAGAAAAIALSGDDESPRVVTTTQAAGLPTVPTVPTETTVPGPPTETIAPTTTDVTIPTLTNQPPPPPPPPSTSPPGTQGSLTTWPANKNGYTVVIDSVPLREGRDSAVASARRALSAGVSETGVLESSEFTSLRPGYYVAFAGVHDTLQEATTAVSDVRSKGFPVAYVREVTPRTQRSGSARGGTL
jgi:hypothetical protein